MADLTDSAAVPAPRLKPTHRPLWRDATTVQLGLLPEHATVLGDMSEPRPRGCSPRWTAGSRSGRPGRPTGRCSTRCRWAASSTSRPQTSRRDWSRSGRCSRLLHPTPGAADAALTARRATRVQVLGGGRGRRGDRPRARGERHRAGRCRGPGTRRSGRRLPRWRIGRRCRAPARRRGDRGRGPGRSHRSWTTGRPMSWWSAPTARRPRTRPAGGRRCSAAPHCSWRRSGEGVGIVGPLTVPYGQCCPGCLSLHRADRDPAWPLVERQLADPDRAPAAAAAATTVLAVAATAADQLLSWIDARGTGDPLIPAAVGATLELPRPGWRWQRRPWGPHPECRCSSLPARAS